MVYYYAAVVFWQWGGGILQKCQEHGAKPNPALLYKFVQAVFNCNAYNV